MLKVWFRAAAELDVAYRFDAEELYRFGAEETEKKAPALLTCDSRATRRALYRSRKRTESQPPLVSPDQGDNEPLDTKFTNPIHCRSGAKP